MTNAITFHLDENVAGAIAVGLRQRGINVTMPNEVGLISASDEKQLHFTHQHKRVLVTHDNDFLRLHHQGIEHSGIVYCKPRQFSIGYIVRQLTLIWRTEQPDTLDNQIIFL